MINPRRLTSLKNRVLSGAVSEAITDKLHSSNGLDCVFAVFLSVCNAKTRALVFRGSGSNLKVAWNNAEKRLNEYLKKQMAKKKPFAVVWAKADVVISYEEIRTTNINKIIEKHEWQNFARFGIAFDKSFNRAFLEAEVSGNKMINQDILLYESDTNASYKDKPINLKTVNKYLKTYYDTAPIEKVPDNIIIFRTCGFFCGEDDVVHELYSDNMDFGRRRVDFVDDDVIRDITIGASKYLVNLIKDNGEFVYGYYPCFGKEMTTYNILRHIGTIWSILTVYRVSKDDSMLPALERAISYFDDFIVHKDEDTAYVVEKKVNEIKLGGNGIAVLMYTEYMDIFKTDKYTGIVKKLANGILELQNPETGKYYHVLNFPDYSKKEEFRIVYYDGEATFALARAYSYIKDKRYLEGAKAAVELFIREDYTKYRDHWVAYSLLELTKHTDDVHYYEFALKNIEKNLEGIYNRATSFHTYLEMLMTGWQTYQRAIKDGIESGYIKKYDPTRFAQTIYHRARHMLNGHFYPEYAMYMKFPQTVAGSFHVRHHNYRVRIDDVQHFIGGYYFYSIYYNEIRSYLTDGFIKELDKSEAVNSFVNGGELE